MAVLAVAGIASAARKGAEGEGAIKFAETVWDFGTIRNDRPAVHDFEFTNDGTGNIVIVECTAECGCTRPEWPEKPVAPGKKGKIKVSYNPVGRPGSFEKTVTVKYKASAKGRTQKVRLKIRGTVAP